jgi:hypothetical protein
LPRRQAMGEMSQKPAVAGVADRRQYSTHNGRSSSVAFGG